MKKILVTSGALLAIVAMAYVLLRIQPAGGARVVRDGSSIDVVTARLGWAPRFAGDSCLVARAGDALTFRDEVRAATREGEPFAFEAIFRYAAPESVPRTWPGGTWCDSLRTVVERSIGGWLAATGRDRLIEDPRAAGADAAARLAADLRALGIHATALAVRPRVDAALAFTRPVPEVAARAVVRPPLVVLALDGADWELLDRFIAEGAMPNLARLRREGAFGSLLTQHPPLSPILWTTMMTGVSPLEHRVLDFTRFSPATGQKEPITSDERQRPAVWNVATAGGRSVAVFGLWATYPAEPVNGVLVSDRFFTFLFSEETPSSGTVFPAWRERGSRAVLAEVENRVGFERLRGFVPGLTPAEYESKKATKNPYAEPISALRRILVETEVYDRLATSHFEAARPDLSIVFIQGTDSIGHVFAPFMPPRQEGIDPDAYAKYSSVAPRYFGEIDALIGRWMARVGEARATLMLVSDHGFHWHEGRPTELSSFAATTAAKWHRKEGIWALWGNGVPPAGRGEAASIQRTAATILALTGLPAGEGLLGPPIGPVEGQAPALDYAGLVPKAPVGRAAAPSAAADEEIAKLRALGYIGAAEPATAPDAAKGSTRTAGSWNNEALILREAGRDADAENAFRRAIAIDPNLASALWNLSDMLFARRDVEEADSLLVRAVRNGLPEGNKFLIGRAIGYQRSGEPRRSLALLEAAVGASPRDVELRLFRGRYRIELADCRGALEDFRAAQQIEPRNPVAWASAGVAAECLGNVADARHYYDRAAQLDPRMRR